MRDAQYSRGFRASIFAVLLFLMGHVAAGAAQVEVGVEYASIASSPDAGGTSTLVPTLGVGGHLNPKLSLFGEVGFLHYNVNKSPNSNQLKPFQDGTLGVTGTSLAAVLVGHLEKANVRFGYGIVQYRYSDSIDDVVKARAAAAGITNVSESLDNTSGRQFLVGMDFPVTPDLFFGAEIRQITAKPDAELKGNFGIQDLSSKETVNLSHRWFGLRLMYQFGVGQNREPRDAPPRQANQAFIAPVVAASAAPAATAGGRTMAIFPIDVVGGTVVGALWGLEAVDRGVKRVPEIHATHTWYPTDTPGQSVSNDPQVGTLAWESNQPNVSFAQGKGKELGVDQVLLVQIRLFGNTVSAKIYLVDVETGNMDSITSRDFTLSNRQERVNGVANAITELIRKPRN